MNIVILSADQHQEIIKKLNDLHERIEKNNHQALRNRILTNNKVAELLSVTTRTLFNWRSKGLIAYSQVGKNIYYRAEDIKLFIELNRKEAFNQKK